MTRQTGSIELRSCTAAPRNAQTADVVRASRAALISQFKVLPHGRHVVGVSQQGSTAAVLQCGSRGASSCQLKRS